jgi:hypothetical protein
MVLVLLKNPTERYFFQHIVYNCMYSILYHTKIGRKLLKLHLKKATLGKRKRR